MFYDYKRLIFWTVMLVGLTGCAVTDPYKNHHADYYDVSKSSHLLATNGSKLNQHEFLDALKLAEQGDAVAQSIIGYSYLYGNPVPRDSVKASFWIQKSAEQGNPSGQRLLGYLCRYGVGVSHDPIQELFWYTKAAENGDNIAQNILGFKYFYGVGVSRDYGRGVEWLETAAASGNVNAKNSLYLLRRQQQQAVDRAITKAAAKAAARAGIRSLP